MNNSYKKIEIILCLAAGVGLFLPLLTISAYGESASVSFMTGFDLPKLVDSGVFNSKLILGIIIVAFIVLLIRTFNNDSFGMRLVSFLLIIASAVLFYLNVDKLGTVKGLVSSAIKYGIGYYVSLLSFIVAIILGIVEFFNEGNSSRSSYPADYDAVINRHYGGQDTINNSGTYNIVNGNNMVNQQYNPNNMANQQYNQNPVPQNNSNNQVKLSDLVSNSAINQENTNNTNNINNN